MNQTNFQKIAQNQQARAMASVAVVALAMTLFGDASAATVADTAKKPLCGMYNLLNGPVGWGLALLMIAFGAVMLMTGNRNANGIIIGALIGGVVLAMSGTLLGVVLGTGQANPCAGNNTVI